MKLVARAQSLPGDAGQWGRGGPLWQRVPKRDAAGRPYIDFMMFAPRLNRRPAHEQRPVQGQRVRGAAVVLLRRHHRHLAQRFDGIDQGSKTGGEITVVVADQNFH